MYSLKEKIYNNKFLPFQYNHYNANELLKIQNLSLLYIFLNNNLKILFIHKIFKINSLNSKNNLTHYCSISGRSKGLYSKFNISRIKLRELAPLRIFTGLKKTN